MADPLRATDDRRQRLRDLGARLLRLHAVLLERERRAYEDVRGPITSGEWLQLLIRDEQFQWLRSLSGIIAGIEAALDEEAPPTDVDEQAFFRQAYGLLRSGGPGAFATNYNVALQESPDVVMAHAEVVKVLPPVPPPDSSSVT